MIFYKPADSDPIDQGDIFDGCPILSFLKWDLDHPADAAIKQSTRQVIILTQTCDLANQKTAYVLVASVFTAQEMVEQGVLKAAEVKGPIRGARIWGWYYLPKFDELGLPEMVIDLRQLHTVPADLLLELCRRGKRRARLQPLYREHLGKHFGDTYSRIGLPEPYPTD